MAPSIYRTLQRSGRIVLIEVGNPAQGIGYAVKIGGLGLWSGNDLTEAQKQFEQATK